MGRRMENVGNPAELFHRFAGTAAKFLLQIRDEAASPYKTKVMRTYGIETAAKMVGRSTTLIRKLEDEEDSPLVKAVGPTPRDANGNRYYTLARVNQYRDYFGTRYKRPAGSRPIRCAVVIFKGGAAKSTTVIHLAQRCAIDGLRVLLLDLDPQATTTNLHGLHPSIDVLEEDTLTDALIENPGAIVSRIRPTHIDGLDLIAGNLYLQNADLILPNAKANNQDTLGLNPIERLDAALRTVEDQYDLILFDCGPNLGSLVLNAVVAADGLLVTIPPMMNDFASSALFFENMNSLYAHSGIRRQLEFVKILITRHTETKEAKDAEALIRVSYGDAVLGPYMVDSVEVERAFNQMGTVYEVQRPRGSPDAYKRALEALDATNLAAIEVFKRTWQRQADAAAAAAGAAVTAEA